MTEMVSENAIQVDGVNFAYSRQPVLEDVSFHIPVGAFVGVVGPNGGGKSTLLKLMLGLLQPDTGTIRILGEAPRRACRRIGYVPQQTTARTEFPTTVGEVVLMGCLGVGRPIGPFSKADRRRMASALDRVGLADWRNRRVRDLSGGQKQRVLIARALVGEPAMLMLDEPTTSLDVRVEAELYELLDELNRSMTIVVVSHDAGFVSRRVSMVVCVQRRVRIHPTETVSQEMLHELYGMEVRRVAHGHDCLEAGCLDGAHDAGGGGA